MDENKEKNSVLLAPLLEKSHGSGKIHAGALAYNKGEETGDVSMDRLVRAILTTGASLTCAVCRSFYIDPVFSTSCSHAYCSRCADAIIANSDKGKAKCPECRISMLSTHMIKNEQFGRIVNLFRRFYPGQSESNLTLTQVSTFSQVAKDLQVSNHVFCEKDTQDDVADNHNNVAIATTDDKESQKTASSSCIGSQKHSSKSDRSLCDGSGTTQDPVLMFSTPNVSTTGTLNLADSKKYRTDMDSTVRDIPIPSSTPSRTERPTTTPPTIRLDDADRFNQHRLPNDPTMTPSQASTSKTTPPTIRLDSLSTPMYPQSASSSTPSSLNEHKVLRMRAFNTDESSAHENDIKSAAVGTTQTPPESDNTPPLFNDKKSLMYPPAVPTQAKVGNGSSSSVVKDQNECIQQRSIATKKDPLRVGAIVTVGRRMGKGENRPGGVAKIKRRNADGTLDVQYVIEGNREKNVPLQFISFGMDLDSSSLFGKPGEGDEPNIDNSKSEQHEISKKGNQKRPGSAPLPKIESSSTPALTKKKPRLSEPHTSTARQLHFTTPSPPNPKRHSSITVVLTGDFSDAQRKTLHDSIDKLGGHVVDSASPSKSVWSSITHVLTSTMKTADGRLMASKRSAKFLRGLSLGLWLVGPEWIDASLEAQQFLPEQDYELCTDVTANSLSLPVGGPKLAREAIKESLASGQNSLLFANSLFAFVGSFDKTPGMDPVLLAEACGGEVFRRTIVRWNEFNVKSYLEEMPKSIERGFIICQKPNTVYTDAISKTLQQNQKRRTTPVHLVKVQWLYDCLSTYTILELKNYSIDLV